MTALNYSSTDNSGSLPLNSMNDLLYYIVDPRKRYEFIVIWSDSAVLSVCVNFVSWYFVSSSS